MYFVLHYYNRVITFIQLSDVFPLISVLQYIPRIWQLVCYVMCVKPVSNMSCGFQFILIDHINVISVILCILYANGETSSMSLAFSGIPSFVSSILNVTNAQYKGRNKVLN